MRVCRLCVSFSSTALALSHRTSISWQALGLCVAHRMRSFRAMRDPDYTPLNMTCQLVFARADANLSHRTCIYTSGLVWEQMSEDVSWCIGQGKCEIICCANSSQTKCKHQRWFWYVCLQNFFFRATCQPRCQRICKQKCDMRCLVIYMWG